MSKLSALIVDDEKLARDLIRAHLQNIDCINILGECCNGLEAIDKIVRNQPDLVFLDIQMPGLTGLELISHIQSDVMPLIIFTTAYDEFAVKAFELHAVDYVMKPIEYERIEMAAIRALERKNTGNLLEEKSKLLNALQKIENKQDTTKGMAHLYESKLAITESGTTNFIPFKDISWIDAAGDYMCVHAKGETHILRSTMKDLEVKLTAPYFQRIHRSTIVNLRDVDKIEKLTKGEALLHLDEVTSLKVSRNYRSFLDNIN